MAISKNERMCLSCTHYRPTDETVGRCRLNRGKIEPSAYPVMTHQDCCDSWQDVGQAYHIRVGWIRGVASKGRDESDVHDNKIS